MNGLFLFWQYNVQTYILCTLKIITKDGDRVDYLGLDREYEPREARRTMLCHCQDNR